MDESVNRGEVVALNLIKALNVMGSTIEAQNVVLAEQQKSFKVLNERMEAVNSNMLGVLKILGKLVEAIRPASVSEPPGVN